MPGMGKGLPYVLVLDSRATLGKRLRDSLIIKGLGTLVNTSSHWPPDPKGCLVGWHHKEYLSPYTLTPDLWPYAKHKEGKRALSP